MRQAARTDNNHKEIVMALRGLGCSVTDTSRLGHGFPDLLVGVDSVSIPVEIKDGKNPLTSDQVHWHREWRGSKAIVRDLKDVGVLVRAMRGLSGRIARKEGRPRVKPDKASESGLGDCYCACHGWGDFSTCHGEEK